MHDYVLWGLLGWGLSSWAMMRIFWQPDPPPDRMTRYLFVSVAGIVGAVFGGLAIGRVQSDPMSGIAAALAGASVLVTLVRGFSGRSGARP